MNDVPENYCDWDCHIIDISYADDGFGTMVLTNLEMFWFNNEQRIESRYGNVV